MLVFRIIPIAINTILLLLLLSTTPSLSYRATRSSIPTNALAIRMFTTVAPIVIRHYLPLALVQAYAYATLRDVLLMLLGFPALTSVINEFLV